MPVVLGAPWGVGRFLPIFLTFLGDSSPRETTIRKTLGTPGVVPVELPVLLVPLALRALPVLLALLALLVLLVPLDLLALAHLHY